MSTCHSFILQKGTFSKGSGLGQCHSGAHDFQRYDEWSLRFDLVLDWANLERPRDKNRLLPLILSSQCAAYLQAHTSHVVTLFRQADDREFWWNIILQ